MFSGDPDLDGDGDGLNAFLEYALGSLARDAGQSPESYPIAGSDSFDNGVGGSDEYLTISFRRNLSADDVIYEVQTSAALEGWSSAGVVYVSAIANGDGTETVTYRSGSPISGSTSEFIRLSVSSRP